MPKRNPDATCATCAYWLPASTDDVESKTQGHCRRFPLVKDDKVRGSGDLQAQYQNTLLPAIFWCGEHPDFFAQEREKYKGCTCRYCKDGPEQENLLDHHERCSCVDCVVLKTGGP